MVFLTLLNASRRKNRLFANPFTTPIPDTMDRTWKRRKVKMCTQHLGFRPRNCYRRVLSRFLENANYVSGLTKCHALLIAGMNQLKAMIDRE